MNLEIYKIISAELTEAIQKSYKAGIASVIKKNKEKLLFSDGERDLFKIDYTGVDHVALQNFKVEAFTVAGVMTYELEEKLKELAIDLQEGKHPLAKGEKDINKVFIAESYNILADYIQVEDFPPPGYLKTNLRTAITSSYHAAQYIRLQDKAMLSIYPAYQYKTLGDNRVREEHVKLNNLIYYADDPIWDRIYPPSAWNCFRGDTLIATPEGWVEIEKINLGDLVYGGSGDIKPVTFKHINFFNGELICINTNEGILFCTPNHRILTMRGWVEAGSLNTLDVIIKIRKLIVDNVIISDIYHSYTGIGNITMPFPAWHSALLNALYGYIYFWKININPVGSQVIIKNNFVAKLFEMFNKFVFYNRRFEFEIRMLIRSFKKSLFIILRHFFSYLRAARRTCSFKFFRNNFKRSIVFFRFSNKWMSHIFSILFHKLGSKQPSFGIVNPLNFNSIPSMSWSNSKMLHKINNCTWLSSPSFLEHSESKKFNTVKISQSFTGGAPLDRFDSLDSFRRYASVHNDLVRIDSITKIRHKGLIYNLEVKDDESYNTKIGIVHNCRCYVKPLDQNELQSSGVEPYTDEDTREAIIKEAKISKDFDRNSGQVRSIWGKWLNTKLAGKNYENISNEIVKAGFSMPDYSELEPFLIKNAVEQNNIEFNKDNWEELFGGFPGSVKTVIGEYKFGDDFFDKLERRDRKDLLGMIKPTLENPEFIFVDSENGTLFVKGFKSKDKETIYVGVLKLKDNEELIISFHEKENIKKKVNEGKFLLYQSFLRVSGNTGGLGKFTHDAGRVNFNNNLTFSFNLKNVVIPDTVDIDKKDLNDADEIWGETYNYNDVVNSEIYVIKYKVEGFEFIRINNNIVYETKFYDYSEIDDFRKGVLLI